MIVIILAAGKGERLRPLTEDRPKCLIEVHPGVPLIELQLRSITSVPEIDRVVMVTGYRAGQIEEYLENNSQLPVTTIYNPFFDISNDLVSLWFARSHMDEPFIVLNGDDVFVPRVLADLVAATGEVCAVIDYKAAYDTDDMKVIIEDDRIKAISKEVPLDAANGESIGMIRFTGAGGPKMREILDGIVRTEGHRPLHWLSAIQGLIDSGVPVNYSECAPEHWAEIDVHVDLRHVQSRLEAAQQLFSLLGAEQT